MEKFNNIIREVEKMSVAELAELVKALEEKFGVSAAMAVSGPAAGAGQEEAEEKTAFDVVMKSAGGQKIQVIKVLREALGVGLKEAKDMTEGGEKVVKAGLKKEEAEELQKKLVEAGAAAEIK
jgi:large subunit ribosomal protein L7/L12